MAKYIYLDQNKWIELARYHTNREKNIELKKIYDLVNEKSKSGEWIFPLSIIHYDETITRKQKSQRYSLAKYMGEISRNWTIEPYGINKFEELKKCVINSYNYTPIKRNPLNIFGKSFDFKNLNEDKILNENNFFLSLMKEDEEWDIDELIENNFCYRDAFEALRKEDAQNPIPEKHKFGVLFTQCFDEEYKEILDKLNVTEKQKENLSYDMYIKQKPDSFYVNMFLIYHSKLKNKYRKNDINDYKDIASISQALPYCDALITEKYWSSLITEHKLDEKYNILVSKNLNDLKKLL
ncbi:hypothetical protein [Clostridioides sp. ZZV15-6598]|uniref:hypothetical protein n=1 Tax=Clostridioides sp. ZZV15-6598 TaxID=2811501 RepID=UPI001D109E0F|nr:hypothetical protein [Clostridioides sp. ZZV15-6598]